MKTIGVADFKARLSHYLAIVRRGATVVVTDRGHPVATVSRVEEPRPFRLPIRRAKKDPAELARLHFPPLPGVKTDSLRSLLEERQEQR